MQLDMSAPCSDWGEIATKSFFTEGNFQITEHQWGKSCPNSSPSILLLGFAFSWLMTHSASDGFSVLLMYRPLIGISEGSGTMGTPLSPILPIPLSLQPLTPSTPLCLLISPPHSETPHSSPMASLCTDWIYFLGMFYLWLQLSLMHSLHAAPLTMFYCFRVLGESMGQGKDTI